MNRAQFLAALALALDFSKDIVPMAEEIEGHWNYDLVERKPGPAYTEDGTFLGTDLDLASFMTGLADRGAVINVPSYKAQGVRTVKANETITSKDNRHGKVLGLVSNADLFSFSVRIEDYNVIDLAAGQMSAPRAFMLVGYDGEWSDSWQSIDFMPDAKENAFLQDRKILDGLQIAFTHFVHPNRWSAFYGRHYLLAKVLQERLGLEISHINAEVKRLKALGIELTGGSAFETTEVGEKVKKTFTGFNAVVRHFDDFHGDLGQVGASLAQLEDAVVRRRSLQRLKNSLAFQTRVIEYAFFRHGQDKPVPSWVEGKWTGVMLTSDAKPSAKGKTEWNKIEILPGIELLYRTFEKTIAVAA